jgi:predicted DNA-binding transcriptional regulator YafY
MSQMERVFSIDRLLRRRTPPTKADLLRQLAVSAATLKRDLEFMRSRLHAPIIWDRTSGGYRYQNPVGSQREFQVPGLWFSAEEIHALLLVRELLSQLQPGFLAEQLEPLGRRLGDLVEASGIGSERIVVHPTPLRPVNQEVFDRVAAATINRKRIGIVYFGRHRNEESDRIISPQCLIYYRGTWYLDAWCHTREDWRRFALDCVQAVRTMTTPALDRQLRFGFKTYGIYAGNSARIATLHFDVQESIRYVVSGQGEPMEVYT